MQKLDLEPPVASLASAFLVPAALGLEHLHTILAEDDIMFAPNSHARLSSVSHMTPEAAQPQQQPPEAAQLIRPTLQTKHRARIGDWF